MVPEWEKKASKSLAVKTWGCDGGRHSQPHRRVHRRSDPQGPRMYTNPPIWEPTQEGPNLLVCTGKSD